MAMGLMRPPLDTPPDTPDTPPDTPRGELEGGAGDDDMLLGGQDEMMIGLFCWSCQHTSLDTRL